MITDETIGSTVVLYHFGEVIEKARIDGQTACYWKLSNGQQFRKDLGYFFDKYSKTKRIDVKFWTAEVEAEYQAHLESKRIASVLSAQKVTLSDYIQYMKTSYFRQLSSDQIANILAVLQDEIGDLSSLRIR